MSVYLPSDRLLPTAAMACADLTSAFSAFRPPKRVSVSKGASETLYLKQPGGYNGYLSLDETPYMVEPMDMLGSRRHEAVCFVGPARTGKTVNLVDGWMAHAVTCDPGDMLILQMTQEKAREFSKTRVERAIRNSPALYALRAGSHHEDNTFDKMFRNGMWLKLGWPSVTQLSGSDYRYVALTDYDRMPDDIDGEGAAFGLALKRTQTFMSRGMCMVESSPGREVTDPNWRQVTAHEAPPCTGILGIYNRSDRRRWYWPCPHCDEFFEAKPGLDLFGLPDEEALIEIVREVDLGSVAKEYNRVICPHCGCLIFPDQKHALNRLGRWVPDGQTISPDGTLHGDPTVSTIAGFWMGGVAATYQSWNSLILRYLQGLREYVLTGSELSLQNTVNTDQGMPYLPRVLASARRQSAGVAGREEDFPRFIVPDGARFLTAAVDVQGGKGARFVVQVHAIGEHLEQWLIDRFEIRDSGREGVDGGAAPIDPASYVEDWDMLTEMVLKATYRTSVDGVEMRVKLCAVDSGGEDGVTDKAYAWYRRCRSEGLHNRIMLVKGTAGPKTPLIKESWVGNKRKGERGDVPIYLINGDLFKDSVSSAVKRATPGAGYMHFPSWLAASFYDEMKAEVRDPKTGRWKKVKARNEAFDLCCYIRAACLRLGADRIKWDSAVPPWALPIFDGNVEVITREERKRVQDDAATGAANPRRRVSRSAYISG